MDQLPMFLINPYNTSELNIFTWNGGKFAEKKNSLL